MSTWNAYGPRGNLLRSFSHRDLAEDFAAWMEAQGTTVTIRRVWQAARAA